MKLFAILILLFFNLNSHGQKSIDTVKGTYETKAVWFDETKRWDKELGLSDLLTTKDSLNIRFRDGVNIVDISISKTGQIIANSYSYLFKLDKKGQRQKIIFIDKPIDKISALSFIDILYKLGIPDFYDGYKIPGYPITVDGVMYTFEISTATTYKQFAFANPTEAQDFKEGQAVESFTKFVYKLINLSAQDKELQKTLEPGATYLLDGTLIYKIP